MVVIYSGSGVLNLAHGAMAMLGAYLFVDFRFDRGWSFWPAFLLAVGLVVVPVVAAALLGGFTSVWLTLLGSFAVGIGEAEVTQYVHQQGVEWSLPFLVIVLVLVVRGKTLPTRGFYAERLPAVGTGRI